MNLRKIDKFLFLWSLCAILNIISFLYIYFKIEPTSQFLSLKYNVLIGVEIFGSGKKIYYLPITAALISIANFGLFRILKNKKLFYVELAVFASLIVQIVLLAGVYFLKIVN